MKLITQIEGLFIYLIAVIVLGVIIGLVRNYLGYDTNNSNTENDDHLFFDDF